MSLPPSHLNGHESTGINPGEPIAQFEIGEMRNFVYLVIDWTSRECAIVDTQKDLSRVREAMRSHQLKLTAVLLTHTHHDHVGGLAELARDFPGVSILLHESDLHRIHKTVRDVAKFRFLQDDETVQVGSIRLKAMHTPGHSPGELCYFLEGNPPYLFTGDTIFIRDCGRTDLPGGNVVDLFDSIQRIKTLPQRTVILCGHHYKPQVASTLAMEMVESAPFRCRNVQELDSLP